MSAAVELAQRVAERLSKVDGVEAVALGGSQARGTASEDSDIDLGIYYYPEQPFSIDELAGIARELDDRHLPSLVTPLGEWGPWINGGGWLVIEGRHVDFLYRDLDKLADVIARCAGGRISCDYQIGHPAGFHSHIYMAEAYYCRLLYDPRGSVRTLKALASEYTPSMRDRIVAKYLYEAWFSLRIADKPAGRRDVHYVSGCLFRAVCCLVQVLYALNRRYFVNEKGSVSEVESMALKPANFEAEVSSILGGIGLQPQELRATVERCRALVQSVTDLCTGDPSLLWAESPPSAMS
jgi:predicted nucleotidyltransferase